MKRDKAMKDLEEFRQRTKQNEEVLIESHRNEIADLNKRLEELKDDVGKQNESFEAMYKRFESEKQGLVEDMKTRHRQEIEKLEEKYANNKDALRLERLKMSEKFEVELSRLRSELDESTSRAANEKLEYEQNLSKLKSFHERELEACKQNSSSEYMKLIDTLKSSLETLKKQKQSDEAEFSLKYNRKLEEIVSKEEEIKSLNDALDKYKNMLDNSNNDVTIVNQKVL